MRKTLRYRKAGNTTCVRDYFSCALYPIDQVVSAGCVRLDDKLKPDGYWKIVPVCEDIAFTYRDTGEVLTGNDGRMYLIQ